MDTEIIWLAPLLILPGIALLINSTSSRYATLHEEIHHWLDGRHDEGVVRRAHLLQRARMFRNALVSLYLGVFLFALASLLGAIVDFMGGPADVVVFSIAVVGVSCLGFASAEMMRESRLSLQVIESHVDDMMGAATPHEHG